MDLELNVVLGRVVGTEPLPFLGPMEAHFLKLAYCVATALEDIH